MDDLADLSLDEFLNRTAQRSPSPGGGSVAAAAGALSAALARMVAAYSTPKDAAASMQPGWAHLIQRLHRADELLRALISRDAAAYTAMSAARPKRGAAATPQYEQAVLAALAVPLEIAAACSEVLAVLDDFKSQANRFLHSDLGAAAVIAEAAIRAARFMVWVNVPELTDASLRPRLLSEIDTIAAHGAAACAAIESFLAPRPDVPPGI
jgi:formiminotetrahydrofolate cyclodeaminase